MDINSLPSFQLVKAAVTAFTTSSTTTFSRPPSRRLKAPASSTTTSSSRLKAPATSPLWQSSMKKPRRPPTAAAAAASLDTTPQSLQSQFDAQTTRLREIHKAQRPKNTSKSYELKQKEWDAWCVQLPGNTDGSWVTEDKLCLFLEQEVVNRESRAPGYQGRKER